MSKHAKKLPIRLKRSGVLNYVYSYNALTLWDTALIEHTWRALNSVEAYCRPIVIEIKIRREGG